MKLFDRTNPVLKSRMTQIARNMAAMKGGRPYIDMRLWRAPNESNLSWFGSNTPDSAAANGMVSRRDRACLVNDAGRIASKIDQYLFSQQTGRAGIDDDWASAVTSTHQSIAEFWLSVSDLLTAGQWVWLQADRGRLASDPATGQPVPRTLLDREKSGDRVVWTAWPSLSVPDWAFDDQGNLLWLLTVETTYDNRDPAVDPQTIVTRTLWRRGENGGPCSWEVWRDGRTKDDPEFRADSGTLPCTEIPFVLVGSPSADPWWFDDLEIMQAQVMNLDSLHVENLVQAAFPQIVIPLSMYENLEARLTQTAGHADGQNVMEIVKELVRGLNNPLVESGDDKGTTRFISGSQTDLTALPNEETRKRNLLFDQAGLALFNKESRQVQSAESKQFDHLDTEATLRHRAALLQAAEKRLVAASVAIDSAFAAYDPVWPSRFDVTDVATDTVALNQLVQMPNVTLTQRKVAAKIITRLLQSFTTISEEDLAEIDAEIDAMEEDDFAPAIPDFELNPPGGEEEEEDEEGKERTEHGRKETAEAAAPSGR